jgi:GNAT superfamily N-acetyltransferase
MVRRAREADVPQLSTLLSEWLKWEPKTGRTKAIRRAIRHEEVIVAEVGSKVIGFVHFVMHEDVVDGGPNAFITAFYVSPAHRAHGAGSRLLQAAVADSLNRGAIGIETSNIHRSAKSFYERLHFKQAEGDMGEVFLELDVEKYRSDADLRDKLSQTRLNEG